MARSVSPKRAVKPTRPSYILDEQIGFIELPPASAEQAECAQHDAGGPHRDGVHRREAGAGRGWNKPRPPLYRPLDIGDRDRLARGVAIHTRAFVGL